MNVDELVAIDIHTHAEVSVRIAPDEAAAVVRSVEAATSESEVEALLQAAALERVGPGAHAFLRS